MNSKFGAGLPEMPKLPELPMSMTTTQFLLASFDYHLATAGALAALASCEYERQTTLSGLEDGLLVFCDVCGRHPRPGHAEGIHKPFCPKRLPD